MALLFLVYNNKGITYHVGCSLKEDIEKADALVLFLLYT